MTETSEAVNELERPTRGRPRKLDASQAPFDEDETLAGLESEYDPEGAVDADRAAFNPFSGYKTRIITARYYVRDPRLDTMTTDELLDYCIRNEYFHREWRLVRGVMRDSKDQHERVLKINTDWTRDKILSYIDRKELHSFPSHHLVFTNIASRKPGVPYAISLKSWITRRFRMIWFDLPWPMVSKNKPTVAGRPNQCAVVDDDSLRAQLMYTRAPRTGNVIRRKEGNKPAFFLLRDDMERSLPILRKIFEGGTKGSADLQRWAREEGGLPEV